MCELVLLCVGVRVCVCEKDQRPDVNEKLAASLILLRVALRLGLSMDGRVFVSGNSAGLSSVLPGRSRGSDVPSATANTSGSSLTVGRVLSSK